MIIWQKAGGIPLARKTNDKEVLRKKDIGDGRRGELIAIRSARAVPHFFTFFIWEDVMSKGLIYRTGVAIKDFGERMGHIKVLGVHIFSWCGGLVIRFGLAIRDSVMGCPIDELYGKDRVCKGEIA